jgi:type II secretory pathway predicted ATPase ExeA
VEHLEHFGLSRDPFSNDPQLSVYFPSAEHSAAERRLQRGVTQQKGLCLLTGPAGAGKSMVVRHLLESLEEEVYQACLLVPVPGVADVTWVLSRFAAHLGVDEPAQERAALLAQIYDQMAIVREDGRHVVLIIDESDVLAERGALGDLRALLNLEYEERRLLTLVLVGPEKLLETIGREAGLAARIDVHVRLRPLDAEAATQYVTHRVRRVGGSPAILDSSALQELIERSGGIVRRLNSIADNALFEAFLAGRNSATREDVKSAADELGTHEATAGSAKPATAAAAGAPRAAGARGGAAPRRQPTDLDSVFDAPPMPSRGPARAAHADMDEVVASATPQPRARAKPAPMPAGRGAPDKTMILSAGEDFDMEEDGFEMRPAPSSGPPKEEEIDDLFAEIVEEN